MRAGRYSIIVGILVLIASLVKGSHVHVLSAPGFRHSEISARVDVRHPLPALHHVAQGESSDSSNHKERRHGKSLVSQAIVADCPIAIIPGFTYCHHNYSLFLPGGCTRQFIGNFSLRGPPAC
ncbi:MAG TPA: hypothetical protein VHD83_05210 [Puia sp.]|nr:hypothetical protein [Puia sp.]